MNINNKQIKACIFDIDGTMVDSCGIWVDVDRNFFLKRGLVQPDDYSDSIGHIGLEKAAIYTINRFHLNEKKEDIIKEWKDAVLYEYANNVVCKPGLKEYLEYLKQNNIKICAATANDEDCYKSCLIHNGIYDYFDFILEVGSFGGGKESPEIYLAAKDRLGFNIDEICVFEDIMMALKTAKNAGFMTVAVNDNNREEEEKKQFADVYISSYKELMN